MMMCAHSRALRICSELCKATIDNSTSDYSRNVWSDHFNAFLQGLDPDW